jgi:hypothetical protein
MAQTMTFNLLTVLGKVKPGNTEDTRNLHNQTAGNPDGVAAAKALGDMSHMVYMPCNAGNSFTGDLLFLDIWNNLDGMNQFFGDHQVQAGAGMMFESRDAVVWSKLDNFLNFHFPAPNNVNNEKIVGIIRGTVSSLADAEVIHNTAMAGQVAASRAAGMLSHEFYSRLAAPGSPEALEVLGVDVWMNAESMMKHYTSPGFQSSGLYKIFAAKPVSSIWAHPQGEWVEW